MQAKLSKIPFCAPVIYPIIVFHAYLNGVICRGVLPPALSFIYQMFLGGVASPLLYYARNGPFKPPSGREVARSDG